MLVPLHCVLDRGKHMIDGVGLVVDVRERRHVVPTRPLDALQHGGFRIDVVPTHFLLHRPDADLGVRDLGIDKTVADFLRQEPGCEGGA